jgi:hypothetical protein
VDCSTACRDLRLLLLNNSSNNNRRMDPEVLVVTRRLNSINNSSSIKPWSRLACRYRLLTTVPVEELRDYWDGEKVPVQ